GQRCAPPDPAFALYGCPPFQVALRPTGCDVRPINFRRVPQLLVGLESADIAGSVAAAAVGGMSDPPCTLRSWLRSSRSCHGTRHSTLRHNAFASSSSGKSASVSFHVATNFPMVARA